MKAFNVYRNGRLVDTVFWNDKADGGAPTTAAQVKESLVNHDGYASDIKVCAAMEKNHGKPTTNN